MLDSIRNELNIQVKDEHCRRLEAALDGLDTELTKISRSRHELRILRLEEVEEDDGLSAAAKDRALLSHLDSRLGHLEREQRTLEEERTSLKNYLLAENQEQQEMTEMLLRRMGDLTGNSPVSPSEVRRAQEQLVKRKCVMGTAFRFRSPPPRATSDRSWECCTASTSCRRVWPRRPGCGRSAC